MAAANIPIARLWALSVCAATFLSALPSLAGKPVQIPGNTPSRGKLVKLTPGDLMCYVDLIDSRGKKHHIGADFPICGRTRLLNRQVRLTYKPIQVNNCQSSEPCGKSIVKTALVKMRLIGS